MSQGRAGFVLLVVLALCAMTASAGATTSEREAPPGVAIADPSDLRARVPDERLSHAPRASSFATHERPFHSPAYIPPGLDVVDDRAPDAAPQVVIGDEDDRLRNTPTTGYPFSAVVKYETAGGPCSGVMIDTNLVLTAGHCLHGGRGGIWLDPAEFVVLPGVDGRRRPFGSCGAINLYSVVGWIEDGNPEYDYGLIQLDCEVGLGTGYFGFTTEMTNGLAATVTGYPVDDPDKPIRTQWGHQGVRIGVVSDPPQELTVLEHWIDTSEGQSGSPLWNHNPLCEGPCVEGVHVSGSEAAQVNRAVKVSSAVFGNLQWLKDNL